jgi:hypothetical protein
MKNNWSVYKHTCPDDSVYYGITSIKPEDRWGNGLHYENQRRFFVKIVKFGWANIKHEVLVSGLDEESARRIESELIHATPYDKCNNTACNVNPKPPKKEVYQWYNDDVSDISCVYASKFEVQFSKSLFSLADEWRENYVINECKYPFAAKFVPGAIELSYMYGDNEHTYFETQRIDVPSELHTYLDYWNYLQEKHEMVFWERSKIKNEDIQRQIDEGKKYA